MPLLSDHFIKQFISAVPKYPSHRLLHLFFSLTTSFGIIFFSILLSSRGLILLLS
jgi:hypothetical protein